ncbi:MAG: hypothetical protein HZC23_04990 [Rhodocyclales bacterium]|nr:hypothetical protein [Rhodocyclales bacterium]
MAAIHRLAKRKSYTPESTVFEVANYSLYDINQYFSAPRDILTRQTRGNGDNGRNKKQEGQK